MSNRRRITLIRLCSLLSGSVVTYPALFIARFKCRLFAVTVIIAKERLEKLIFEKLVADGSWINVMND